MEVQILLVGLFAVNLLLLWKFRGYYHVGLWLMLIIPFITAVLPQPRFELDYFWWEISGVVAVVLGLIIAARARLELKSWGAALSEILVTTGPYQFLRHPVYLGLIFIMVGWWWVWAAVYGFYFGMFILAMIWVQGYLEEKLILEKKFGPKFLEYRQRTGMFWIK